MIIKIKCWYYHTFKYHYEKQRDNFNLWLAGKLPKRLVMWCFIKIHSQEGNAPCECYSRLLRKWDVK